MAGKTVEAGQGSLNPKRPIEPPANASQLTVPEAAFVLRVSVDTIYRLIGDGKMESTRIGAKRFILRTSLTKFLDDNTGTIKPVEKSVDNRQFISMRESGLWDGKPY